MRAAGEGRRSAEAAEALAEAEANRQARQAGAESLDMARGVLDTLAGQQESMERTATTLDSHQYVLDMSERAIRSLSFLGRVANFFTSEPDAVERATQCEGGGGAVAAGEGGEGTTQADRPPPPPFFSPLDASAAHAGQPLRQQHRQGQGQGQAQAARTGLEGTRFEARAAAQEKHVEELGRDVDELSLLTQTVGAAVSEQTQLAEEINRKAQTVHDNTRIVGMKTSRAAQGGWSGGTTHVTNVALQHRMTGKFLTVLGDGEPMLRDSKITKASTFEVHMRQGEVCGLRSLLTRQWLGITLLGYMRFSASSMCSYEELWIEMVNPNTRPKLARIYCNAANWGSGGWLGFNDEDELIVVSDDVHDRSRATVFAYIELGGGSGKAAATAAGANYNGGGDDDDDDDDNR